MPFIANRWMSAFAVLIYLGYSVVAGVTTAEAQTAVRYRQRPIYLVASTPAQRAESIRNLGVNAIRDVSKLPFTLPILVEALNDQDREVRIAAARALGNSSAKLERMYYQRKPTPVWEKMEPQYLEAIDRLGSLKSFDRTQRQLQELVSRRQRQSQLAAAARAAYIPSGTLHEDARRFVEEFCRLEENQIVEMWRLTKENLPNFDSLTRQAIFAELLEIAPPRWFEFTLTLSEEYDNEIVLAVLQRSTKEISPAGVIALLTAKPSAPEVETHLVRFACNSQRDEEDRALYLNCLTNADALSPESVNALVHAYLKPEFEGRQYEFYNLLVKHKLQLSEESIGFIKGHALPRIGGKHVETWRRCELIHAISDLLPGDHDVLVALRSILELDPNQNEELVLETLIAMPTHGRACASVASKLIQLSQSGDYVVRECALDALKEVRGLDSNALEMLIAKIANQNETGRVKLFAAQALRSNSDAAVGMLQKTLQRNLDLSEDRRCVADLLRAAEIVGQRDDLLDRLSHRISHDSSRPLQERLAAIHERGSCSLESGSAIQDLLSTLNDENEKPEIKAASLQSLALLAKSSAIPTLAQFTQSDSEVLACTASYAYHLAGESNTAVHLLLAKVPTSVFDETIESTLLEIGESGSKALLETLDSRTATNEQKQMAFRTLVAMPKPDWNHLLRYLNDSELGKEYENSLRTAWNFDTSIVPALFQRIENSPVDSFVAKQSWQLADDFTSGLGAGGVEDSTDGSAMRRAIAYSASIPKADAVDDIVVESPLPVEVVAEEPRGSGAPVAFSPPILSPPASSANTPPILADTGIKETVDVFYGTNRQTLVMATLGARLQWAAFAVSLLCMLFCIVGFARQRAIQYTIAGLLSVLAMTFFASDSLDLSYWFPSASRLYSGNYSDDVKMGVCKVTIPKTHVPGELESPSLFLRLEVRPDPNKHIVLADTQPLGKEEFFDKLRGQMDQKGKNLLVFIHGYNVSFEDAARRTAQMAVDLRFQGAPVFYSWPSQGDWYRYPDDAINIQNSVSQIRNFLEQLASDSGATSINIIAHSMGNVGLTNALATLDCEQPIFNQVVLAAPDIDAKVFRDQIAPKIVSKAKRMTLYTSQTDLALLASRYFNEGLRVGDSSRGVEVFPGIETIDATSIDSSLLGHSYYGSNVSVLEDIAKLLSDIPINSRQYLEFHSNMAPPYWSFSPSVRMATQPGAVKEPPLR